MAVDGKWNITINSPMGSQEAELVFKAEGDRLMGMQIARQGSKEIANGRVDGNNVFWSADISQPFPITLEFSGTVNGDSISGSVTAGAFGSFPFSGRRVA